MGGSGDGESNHDAIHVMWATQTGNAREIARRIHAQLESFGFLAGELCSVEDHARVLSGDASLLVLVAATTGDGDATDDARALLRFLRKAKSESGLRRLRYALLGLGDTNYENFCNGPIRLDKALRSAGATRFYDFGKADDGVGLELVVEPWIDRLWTALRAEVGTSGAVGLSTEDIHVGLPALLPSTIIVERLPSALDAEQEILPFKSNSLTGRIVNARLLTDSNCEDRRVWHVEVELGQSAVCYVPGDAFGVWVENLSDDVDAVLARAGEQDPDQSWVAVTKVDDGSPVAQCSVRELISHTGDLYSPPKKTFLRGLAEYCVDNGDRDFLLRLCSRDGRDDYRSLFLGEVQFSVVDLLLRVPSCRPSLELLCDQLPPLLPRHYSASSCPEVDGSRVHFAFSVVTHRTASGGERQGLATGKLERLCKAWVKGGDGSELYVRLSPPEHSGTFCPPADMSTPYIMICPGTGVTPFRGFLRQRQHRLKSAERGQAGSCWLFFGCRQREIDFLYADELESFHRDEVLNELVVAFSRAQDHKVYVQHKLIQYGKELFSVLTSDPLSRIYVCGDGRSMASDVQEALLEIISDHGVLDARGAELFLKQLSDDGRYRREIWYWG
mmetsp:Transcript_3911/g.7507  ORF Transcript_3911/g.7507 Transcript_3911/m.7507 type:complete len:616 (-) Transcript_3911:1893-3740(-)